MVTEFKRTLKWKSKYLINKQYWEKEKRLVETVKEMDVKIYKNKQL